MDSEVHDYNILVFTKRIPHEKIITKVPMFRGQC